MLTDKTCRWPLGDPGTEDFCFCGHLPRAGFPYCSYHISLAYQPRPGRCGPAGRGAAGRTSRPGSQEPGSLSETGIRPLSGETGGGHQARVIRNKEIGHE
jgi:hypothetical protein